MPRDRSAERAAVAHEPAAAGRRVLSRFAAARGRAADEQMYGHPGDLDADDFYRRTVYGQVSSRGG